MFGGGGEKEKKRSSIVAVDVVARFVVLPFPLRSTFSKQTLNADLKNEPSRPSDAAATTLPPLCAEEGEGGGRAADEEKNQRFGFC